MNEIISPLSSMSYTNKDFTNIYEELLDLVKELTQKWDPSISNESDPGVILLKLNALIADKCNYVTDKGVLECFPLSVTQMSNARQLYEQLGYYMHWYQSATTTVTIRWIGPALEGKTVTIPAFSKITGSESSIIYTLIGVHDGGVGDVTLKCDGAAGNDVVCDVIQGIPATYQIGSSSLITVANLDYNNRLYFTAQNVAENGIFITNVNANNFSVWKKKDNLHLENFGNTFYKFGVLPDESNCYIEFPEDADTIFGEGINVLYITSAGDAGNIKANTLVKLYDELNADIDGELYGLSEKNISIKNTSAAVNGSNYEEINDAYNSYKKTIGTFNTLVTLRDYINAIVNSGLCNNGFVCDRNNDIQSTYRVISSVNNIDQNINYIEDGLEEDLTAFSLKFYVLRYAINTDTFATNKQSFDMLTNDSSVLGNIKAYIEDEKTLCHDYNKLIEATSSSPHVCYFKNICPIRCTIIAQTKLTANQRIEVKENIQKALYSQLNSSDVEFGVEIPYETVYNIILNADSRIKNVSLNNLVYTTQAARYHSGEELTCDGTTWYNDRYEEVDPAIYGYHPSGAVATATLTIPDYIDYEYINGDYYDDIDFCSNTLEVDGDTNTSYYRLDYVKEYARTEEYEGTVFIDANKYYSKLGFDDCYKPFELTSNSDGSVWTWSDGSITKANLESQYGISFAPDTIFHNGDKIKIRLSYGHQVRDDIYAKSALAGVTPFFVKDTLFEYKMNQYADRIISNIATIQGNAYIEFNNPTLANPTANIYHLRTHEGIQLYAPNLLEIANYSNYVKFEYRIRNDIAANTCYQLLADEYLALYWTETDDIEGLTYKYFVYGYGSIICPSFVIEGHHGDIPTNIVDNASYHMLEVNTTNNHYATSVTNNNTAPLEAAKQIKNLVSASHLLSGSKKISIKVINQFNITANSGYSLYWLLNETVDENYYVLFAQGEESRILESGEYVIYTDVYKTDYQILGAGTTLTRTNDSSEWRVTALNASEVLDEGMSALESHWFTISDDAVLTITENQFTNIGSGCNIKIESVDPVKMYSVTINAKNSSDVVISPTPYQFWSVDGTHTETGLEVWKSNTNYQAANATYTFVYNSSDDAWYWGQEEISLDDIGIEIINSHTPLNGEKILVTNNFSYKITFNNDKHRIYIPSDAPVESDVFTLNDFNISYQEENSDDWIDVSGIDLSTSSGWNGRSLFSIGIDSNSEQYMLSNQSLIYNIKDDSTTDYTISGSSIADGFVYNAICHDAQIMVINSIDFDVYNALYPYGLHEFTYTDGGWENENGDAVDLADCGLTYAEYDVQIGDIIQIITYQYYPVVLLGSQNINVSGSTKKSTYDYEFTDDGNLVTNYLSLYKFGKYLSIPNKVVYTSSGMVSVTIPSAGIIPQIPFSIPVGNYILPVTHNQNDITSLKIYLDQVNSDGCVVDEGDALEEIYADEAKDGVDYSELSAPKNHYLSLNLLAENEGYSYVLRIECTGHTTDFALNIGNCYAYTKPKQIATSDFNRIKHLISVLDSKHVFDYVIQSGSAVIEDPTAAESFNNTTHIYNPFTICELSTITIS